MAGAELGRQPALGALGAGENLDEVRARHLRLVDRDVVDLALVAADLVDQAAHAVGQALYGARGEADGHQLVRDLVANAQVILVLGAFVFQSLEKLLEQAADARELLQRLAFELEHARRLRGLGGLFVLFAFFFLDLRFLVLRRRRGLLRIEAVLGVRVDQAIDHLVDAHLVLLDLVGEVEDLSDGSRAGADREDHVAQAVLDALGDLDLAFARQELDRAHLAHVHAHRVGGAAELGIHGRKRGLGLLLDIFIGLRHRRRVGGDQQLLLVGRLVVDLDAHVAERGDDRFDLLGIDQIVGQVVVDLGIGEEAALLAELDQVLEARAPGLGVFLRHLRRDVPCVLAAATAAAAALAFGLDLVDLGFEELERRLRALDRRLGRLAGLVVGLACNRLAGDNLRRRCELARALGLLRASDFLMRARLRDVTLQRASDVRLFLGCSSFLDLGLALLMDHPSPDKDCLKNLTDRGKKNRAL